MDTAPYVGTDPNAMGVQCFHARIPLKMGGKVHTCGGKGHYLCITCSALYFPFAVHICYSCVVEGVMLLRKDTSPRGQWANFKPYCSPISFHRQAVKNGLVYFDNKLPNGPIVTNKNEPHEITATRDHIVSSLDHYSKLYSTLSGIVRSPLPVAISNSKRQISDDDNIVLSNKQVKTNGADVPIEEDDFNTFSIDPPKEVDPKQVKTNGADVPTEEDDFNTFSIDPPKEVDPKQVKMGTRKPGNKSISASSEQNHNLADAVSNNSSPLVEWTLTPSPLIKQIVHSTSPASPANLSNSLLNTPEGFYDQLTS
jgi:hypothetical protein